jgi:Flp pilus assembly protein TadG
MHLKRIISRGRLRRSGGNAAVEGVLVLLPTMALLMSFIDFGLMFYRWSTLQNAVREGARYAITFDTDDDPNNAPQAGQSQSAAIKRRVERYAMGVVKTTDSPATIFVNFYTQAGGAGTNIPGNVVEVSVVSPGFRWIAPLSGTLPRSTTSPDRGVYASGTMAFRVFSSDILGGYPAGVSSVTP